MAIFDKNSANIFIVWYCDSIFCSNLLYHYFVKKSDFYVRFWFKNFRFQIHNHKIGLQNHYFEPVNGNFEQNFEHFAFKIKNKSIFWSKIVILSLKNSENQKYQGFRKIHQKRLNLLKNLVQNQFSEIFFWKGVFPNWKHSFLQNSTFWI